MGFAGWTLAMKAAPAADKPGTALLAWVEGKGGCPPPGTPPGAAGVALMGPHHPRMAPHGSANLVASAVQGRAQ